MGAVREAVNGPGGTMPLSVRPRSFSEILAHLREQDLAVVLDRIVHRPSGLSVGCVTMNA
ncbi:hypothetical protein ACWGIU_13220 [Streptomyces sp. NPDC054840]